MEEEACGKLAVSMLNGRNVRGNTISVLQSNQSDLGPKIASTRLCVKNIPASLSAAGLRDLFKKYGLVLAAEITNETGIVVSIIIIVVTIYKIKQCKNSKYFNIFRTWKRWET